MKTGEQDMKEFDISTNVFFGENSLGRLDRIQGKRVLIICDAFMVKSGVVDKIKSHLHDCQVEVFDKTVPDPPIEVVSEGIQCLTQCQAQIMIAVGGGSAIDAAKAIRVIGHRLGLTNIEECFAIPTTSGTGSEVTKFSVITNKAEGVKYPLIDQELQPMVAILDPELVKTMPPSITADTGMDALTHALEAYVSTEATDFTDALSEKAVTLLMKFLPMAFLDGNDLLAREKVHNAACLAGMAFNTAGLGINHSIAHAIGAKFHISHGRSNAMVLPEVIRFNANLEGAGDGSSAMAGAQGAAGRAGQMGSLITVQEGGYNATVVEQEKSLCARKLQRMAKLCGLPHNTAATAVTSLAQRIEGMKRSFGIPATLKDLGIDPAEVKKQQESMVEAALADSCTKTNPRQVSADDIRMILARITPM